jgi:uncharacterized protein (UPF0276 family)
MSATPHARALGAPVPASAGIGLRSAHLAHFIDGHPDVPWLEVHSENYFAAGGAAHATLTRIRSAYPLSFHGGLSLGPSIRSTAPTDRLRAVRRYAAPSRASVGSRSAGAF